MSNTINDSAIRKLKLLFTVVDRPKGEFYLDVISQFDVNCQLAVAGQGILLTHTRICLSVLLSSVLYIATNNQVSCTV